MNLSEADLSEPYQWHSNGIRQPCRLGQKLFCSGKGPGINPSGDFRITDRGRELLAKGHPRIMFGSWTSTLNLLNFIR